MRRNSARANVRKELVLSRFIRLRTMLGALFALGLLLQGTAPVGWSQAAPSPVTPEGTGTAAPYRLQIQSQMVVLDVVVRDGKMNPVRGLTAQDFSVFDGGLPQRILSFESADASLPKEGQAVRIESASELDRLAPHSPVNIIVLDQINTTFEDEYFARYSLDKYLKGQGDLLDEPTILIARTVTRMMVLCDYTTSRSAVMAALKRHVVGSDWKAKDPNRRAEQVGAPFVSLMEIAKSVQGHAGHKNLIWIGRGFPSFSWQDLPPQDLDSLRDAVIECANILRESRITLYAIDPTGVTGANVEREGANGELAPDDPFGGAVDFGRMATATGGLAIRGRNDVDRLIGQAVDSGEVFYTLTFRPTQPLEGEGAKFRQITVTMKNANLSASTREGYYPSGRDGKQRISTSMAQSAQLGLSGAATSLLTFDGIPLKIERTTEPGHFNVSFPESSLSLQGEGKTLSGDVDLLVLGYDRGGKLVTSTGKVISLHRASTQAPSPDNLITLTTVMSDLQRAVRLRFVVREHLTGKIGAENYFLNQSSSPHETPAGATPPGTK